MENPIQTDFIRWIVFLPLLGAIVNGLLGAKIQKKFGKSVIGWVACIPVIVAFVLSVNAFLTLKGLEPEKRFIIDNLYRWIDLGSLKVDMAFLVDPLSSVMILIVTGIGGLIHIYATGYMHDDKAFWRFFAYLNLFTAAMLTLVLGDSLLLLFVMGRCRAVFLRTHRFLVSRSCQRTRRQQSLHRQPGRRFWLCPRDVFAVLVARRARPWIPDVSRNG